jgi:cation transport ATPase
MNRATLQSNDNAAEGVLYMAMELDDKRWQLMFGDGVRSAALLGAHFVTGGGARLIRRVRQPRPGHGRAGLRNEMAQAGLWVLAFAQRALASGAEACDERLTLAGLAGLEDPPRPEVPEAIARCHAAGIRVIMVTGDHPRTALTLARERAAARGL